MQQKEERNSFSKAGWILTKVPNFSIIQNFDCGDFDLNDYFKQDALTHRNELLTETYCLKEITEDLPVALVSLCNDSIRQADNEGTIFKKWRRELNLDRRKWYFSYPAVKIARFGVCVPFQKRNVGSYAINMIKEFFIIDNRTGCRFITVDAYNKSHVLNFYKKNEFEFFSEEDKDKRTRSMFFDLKRLTLEGGF